MERNLGSPAFMLFEGKAGVATCKKQTQAKPCDLFGNLKVLC